MSTLCSKGVFVCAEEEEEEEGGRGTAVGAVGGVGVPPCTIPDRPPIKLPEQKWQEIIYRRDNQ